MLSRPLVRRLAEEIQHVEQGLRGGKEQQLFSTGIAALDCLLPAGGLRRGMLIEWLSTTEEGGNGASLMALLTARAALASPQFGVWNSEREQTSSSLRIHAGFPLVIIDRHGIFYPPAAAAWGIPLASMILVRPVNARDEAWALDQVIRSPAVAAVLAWPHRLDARTFRRLQLAAESSGTVGVFIRPASARCEPTWADVRLRVANSRFRMPESRLDGTDHKIPSPQLPLSNLQNGWHIGIERLRARACIWSHDTVQIEITPDGQIRESPPADRSAVGASSHDQSSSRGLKFAI